MRSPKLAETARNFATSANTGAVLIRFLAVGGLFALLYSALSSAFALLLHLPAAGASALAYLLCIPPAYFAQRALAFRSNAPHRRAFARYALLQAPLVALGAFFSWLLITKLHGPTILSFLVIGPAVALVSFAAQRAWTFSHR